MGLTIVGMIAAVVMAQTPASDRSIPLVTVCEILEHRAAYDGKVVGLIGRGTATDEGLWLSDDCRVQIKSGDHVWPNLVVLKYDPSLPSLFRPGFKPDRSSVNKKIEALKARPSTDTRTWMLIYGRIETKEELSRYGGYGHMSASPAQIIYRERDIFSELFE